MAEYSIGYNFQNKIIDLPDKWKVKTFKTVKPQISKKEIKNAIINPVNSKRICDLARKGDTVSIIIEDMSIDKYSRALLYELQRQKLLLIFEDPAAILAVGVNLYEHAVGGFLKAAIEEI